MWNYYDKKPLKQAKGGIKAQSKKGEFAKSWWAKRWISALESFSDSSRLSRGKTYARKGQVLTIDITTGLVKAKVQGSSATPYRVTIEIDTLSKESWLQVAEALNSQAIYAAKLLAGEMPQDIENIFKETKLSLLPTEHNQLKTDCSCPDWSNPCKHVAAVYYLLGEEFDRDPFLIFKLRGMERESLIELLMEKSKKSVKLEKEYEELNDELSSDQCLFWQGSSLENLPTYELSIPEIHSGLLKSLGKFPFWRGQENLQDALEGIYKNASNSILVDLKKT